MKEKVKASIIEIKTGKVTNEKGSVNNSLAT